MLSGGPGPPPKSSGTEFPSAEVPVNVVPGAAGPITAQDFSGSIRPASADPLWAP